jgi:hypothetical protein
MSSGSPFDFIAQRLVGFERAEPDADEPIACIVVPHDKTQDITEQQLNRDNLGESFAAHFMLQDAQYHGLCCIQIDIENPESSELYAVMLENDHRGRVYNNRASALLAPMNVSSDLLVFSLNDNGQFASYASALRTTIAGLCDEARRDTFWGTAMRSWSNKFARTKIGKMFEGWNTPPDQPE